MSGAARSAFALERAPERELLEFDEVGGSSRPRGPLATWVTKPTKPTDLQVR